MTPLHDLLCVAADSHLCQNIVVCDDHQITQGKRKGVPYTLSNTAYWYNACQTRILLELSAVRVYVIAAVQGKFNLHSLSGWAQHKACMSDFTCPPCFPHSLRQHHPLLCCTHGGPPPKSSLHRATAQHPPHAQSRCRKANRYQQPWQQASFSVSVLTDLSALSRTGTVNSRPSSVLCLENKALAAQLRV